MAPKKSLNYLESFALILAILSIVAIFLYPFIFQKSLRIDVASGYPRALSNDVYNNGNSSATLLNSENSYKWVCTLRTGYAYPYCAFKLSFVDHSSERGLDLSNYDEITIDYDFKGNDNDTFRIFFRSHHEGLTDRNDQNSFKFNGLELKPSRDGSPVTYLMSDFKVALWWILSLDLPAEMARTDFSEVMYIEILTGTNSSLGEKEFELKHITLTGKIISKASFYLAIIVTWLVFLFVGIGYRLFLLKRAFNDSQQEQSYLKEIADQDQLTQLLNRRAIDKLFIQMQKDWITKQESYSLIIIDIDHFKDFNDNYGHVMGDKVLKVLAKFLLHNSRKQDYVGRWGGEEFIVLLPSTTSDEAVFDAERLRSLIEKLVLPDNLTITASFGVSTATRQLSIEQTFEQADVALYHSKSIGRNKVTRSESLPPQIERISYLP